MMAQNRVREIRSRVGMAQKDLAAQVGVTRQTISLIEKGDYNPTINLCLNICYALGYKLDDLFWVDEGKRRA